MKAPSLFTQRNMGKTLVTRTQGTKVRDVVEPCLLYFPPYRQASWQYDCKHLYSCLCCKDVQVGLYYFSLNTDKTEFGMWEPQIASDGLKGRVFECSLADLNQVWSSLA